MANKRRLGLLPGFRGRQAVECPLFLDLRVLASVLFTRGLESQSHGEQFAGSGESRAHQGTFKTWPSSGK